MGNSASHQSHTLFLAAAKEGDATYVLEALHNNSIKLVYSAQTWTGQTIFHVAARHGHVQLMSSLVQACFTLAAHEQFQPDKALSQLGSTMHAIVRALANDRDQKGMTPLMVAAANGQTECLQYLLHLGADPRMQDCMGRTAVHFAASLDHPECILALAEHDTANPEAAAAAEGTRLVDVQNNAGFCALHFAAWVGCHGALSALLSLDARQGLRSCSGSGDWITCPVGSTSLHLAAMRGHLQAAKALLLDYALKFAHLTSAPNSSRASLVDPRRMATLRGTLPWQVARDRGHSALAELLHPDLPLGFVLEQEELEQAGHMFGAPRLFTIAAAALHAKLLSDLDMAAQHSMPLPSVPSQHEQQEDQVQHVQQQAQQQQAQLFLLPPPGQQLPITSTTIRAFQQGTGAAARHQSSARLRAKLQQRWQGLLAPLHSLKAAAKAKRAALLRTARSCVALDPSAVQDASKHSAAARNMSAMADWSIRSGTAAAEAAEWTCHSPRTTGTTLDASCRSGRGCGGMRRVASVGALSCAGLSEHPGGSACTLEAEEFDVADMLRELELGGPGCSELTWGSPAASSWQLALDGTVHGGSLAGALLGRASWAAEAAATEVAAAAGAAGSASKAAAQALEWPVSAAGEAGQLEGTWRSGKAWLNWTEHGADNLAELAGTAAAVSSRHSSRSSGTVNFHLPRASDMLEPSTHGSRECATLACPASPGSSHAACGPAAGSTPGCSAAQVVAAPSSCASPTTASSEICCMEVEQGPAEMCGVCLDADVQVQVQGCGHQLCLACSQELVRLHKLRPVHCPFCRQCIGGFTVAL